MVPRVISKEQLRIIDDYFGERILLVYATKNEENIILLDIRYI